MGSFTSPEKKPLQRKPATQETPALGKSARQPACRVVLAHQPPGRLSAPARRAGRNPKDDLVNAGAVWADEAAFREGNQVWGRVVADIPDFNRELVKALIEG